MLVEKILEPGEPLPPTGRPPAPPATTRSPHIDRVLTDPAGEAPLTALEDRLRGTSVDWHAADPRQQARRRRRHPALRGPAHHPRGRARAAAAAERRARDEDAVADAIAELLACFPVYRSYLPEGREHLEQAFAAARADAARPRGDVRRAASRVLHDEWSQPARRFQQTSGMVMAKGVEDCSFYRWSRLTSLTEVGGDPSIFAIGVDDVPRARWPRASATGRDSMITLSTHDTKRGEDVRARINVLAEVPGHWAARARRAAAARARARPRLRRRCSGRPCSARGRPTTCPTCASGCTATPRRRCARQATRTTWTEPDEAYESRVHAVVDAVFDVRRRARRAGRPRRPHRRAGAGQLARGQAARASRCPACPTSTRAASCGRPRLVDPDNRRPVDFDRPGRGARPAPHEDDARDQAARHLHARCTLRRERPELFTPTRRCTAPAPAAGHVLAFDRGGAITVATRLPVGLAAAAAGATRTARPARGPLARRCSPASTPTAGSRELLAVHPVALLVRKDAGTRETALTTSGRRDRERVRLTVAARGGQSVVRDGPRRRRLVDARLGRPGRTVRSTTATSLDDDPDPRPDPRSRRQPDGVHGLVARVDATAYEWQDAAWTGRQLAGSVIYELHVGTFTPEGTLDSAIERLDHLVDLGVDLVEVMPVNAFNGTHNWGYDGVAWFAVARAATAAPRPTSASSTRATRRASASCRTSCTTTSARSGNYLPAVRSLPQGRAATPGATWSTSTARTRPRCAATSSTTCACGSRTSTSTGCGSTPCTPSATPRRSHLLEEMADRDRRLLRAPRRPLTLIAESDLNDTAAHHARARPAATASTPQWSDDFHHAVHVALSGETTGYYADFEPLEALAKVLREGLLPRRHVLVVPRARPRRAGRHRHMPTWRLVVANQNHDQIGNRARGDRLAEHLDDDQLAFAALLTLAGPFTPMLFMGEEWAASSPFQFFTSHPEPELGKATAEGRIAEFAKMGWDPAEVPDPQDPETFHRSQARLGRAHRGPARGRARLLPPARAAAARAAAADRSRLRRRCRATWTAALFTMRRGDLLVVVNAGDSAATTEVGRARGALRDALRGRRWPARRSPSRRTPARCCAEPLQ